MTVILRWLVPLLVSALAKDVALGIVLLTLKKISEKTKTTYDDEVLALIEMKLAEHKAKAKKER